MMQKDSSPKVSKTCLSFLLYGKSEYFYSWTHQILNTATLLPHFQFDPA